MPEKELELPACRKPFESFAAAPASAGDPQEHIDTPVFLIVEDDWLLREAIAEELTAAGWLVTEAESGETALALLKANEPVDVLITDIRLGGTLDGWDIAEAFRASNAKLPVIYISGNPVIAARQVANSVFLPKPCDMKKLVEACKALT